jgi:hypothetical protein
MNYLEQIFSKSFFKKEFLLLSFEMKRLPSSVALVFCKQVAWTKARALFEYPDLFVDRKSVTTNGMVDVFNIVRLEDVPYCKHCGKELRRTIGRTEEYWCKDYLDDTFVVVWTCLNAPWSNLLNRHTVMWRRVDERR